MNEIEEYLKSKGFDLKREGNEAVIVCPYCNRPKLYINILSGVFHCFHCEAEEPDSPYKKGHIAQLKEVWGDILPIASISDRIEPDRNQQEVNFSDLVSRYHFNLINNERSAMKYLIKRGITEESIVRFKLGFTRRFSQNWISIPSYENGIPKLIKYRKAPPEDENPKLEKYIREKNSKSILFNGDAIKDCNEAFVVEGEFDAISLIQQGYENVAGMTGGAGTLLPEWYDLLMTKDRIYLVLDSDSAGQNAAKDVWATRLGIYRCWNILLPKDYDLNKYFLEYTTEQFEELIKKSKQFKIDGVVSLGDALREMYRYAEDETNIEKYALPWPSVNKLLGGGLMRKRLTVLAGIPGVGKTSFSLQIMYHMITEYKIPGLFWCMEMPETSLATKIVQLKYDMCIEEVDPSNGLIYAMELEHLPLYFGYSSKITPEIFYNTMKEARNRYGIQFGVFDNLHRMIRSGEEHDLGKASGMFKDICMDLNILFILVCQPRKLNSEDTPTYDSIKGSSAIPADSDEVILLHRLRDLDEGALKPDVIVRVDKSRFATGGRTKLHFEGAKSSFYEKEDEKD